jgi:hypothetical protein
MQTLLPGEDDAVVFYSQVCRIAPSSTDIQPHLTLPDVPTPVLEGCPSPGRPQPHFSVIPTSPIHLTHERPADPDRLREPIEAEELLRDFQGCLPARGGGAT